MQLRRRPHRGQVSGAVPGRAHPKGLAQNCQLPGRGQSADLAQMHPDVVEPLGHQLPPLQGVVEQLAHCDGHRRLGPHGLEPLDLLRGQGVLQEEQPVRLQLLCQTDGLDGRQPLVDVVEQFDLIPQFVPQVGKELHHSLAVLMRVVVGAGLAVLRGDDPLLPLAHLAPVDPHLAPEIAVALLHILADVLLHLFWGGSVRVPVYRRGLTAFPAEQVVYRHVRHFALDVP